MEVSITQVPLTLTIEDCEPGTIASKPGSGPKFVVLLFNKIMYDDFSCSQFPPYTSVVVHGKLNLKLDKD